METETIVESEREKGFNYSATRGKYYTCNRAKYGCKAKFTTENDVVISMVLNHTYHGTYNTKSTLSQLSKESPNIQDISNQTELLRDEKSLPNTTPSSRDRR